MPDNSTPHKRLTLKRCTVSAQGKTTVDAGEGFTAMINPAEFKVDRAISYGRARAFGRIGTDRKFDNIQSEKVSFDLVLDGTGVVPPQSAGAAVKSVQQHMQDLLQVVYKFSGEKHEPSRVQLAWGQFHMHCRLTSMSTRYTLFKPDGLPLRAKLSLAFVGYLSENEAALKANMSSPDLSHSVEVRMGDTLPLLCQRIYGNTRYYLAVAQFNQLSDFRRLTPGARLHFPPLA